MAGSVMIFNIFRLRRSVITEMMRMRTIAKFVISIFLSFSKVAQPLRWATLEIIYSGSFMLVVVATAGKFIYNFAGIKSANCRPKTANTPITASAINPN